LHPRNRRRAGRLCRRAASLAFRLDARLALGNRFPKVYRCLAKFGVPGLYPRRGVVKPHLRAFKPRVWLAQLRDGENSDTASSDRATN
jgi:hypothetical protein